MSIDAGPYATGGFAEVARVESNDRRDRSFINRELSWLSFNARVLEQAADSSLPLVERVRFLAIFSQNLDEFFQVRVAGLKDQEAARLSTPSADGRTPQEQLEEISIAATALCAKREELFFLLADQLADAGLGFVSWDQLDEFDQRWASEQFDERIFPVLTPLAVDPAHPFPYISDLSLNLAVVVVDPSDRRRLFARVKVPNSLPRYVTLPDGRLLPLEQLIAAHLSHLFPGMDVVEHQVFRVTRNADLTLEEEEADDLLAAVEMELRRRRFGGAIRLELSRSVSDEVRELLVRELDLGPLDVYETAAHIDLRGVNQLVDQCGPALLNEPWAPVVEPELAPDEDGRLDVFERLRQGDVVVQHPYSSFDSSVAELVRQAALDPAVLAIKMTLYRTSGDSPIVQSLIHAVEAGKQVAVLVELKARFDEAANISWAKRLEQAGVHVAYGLVGLKIHSKVILIVREQSDGIARYCHVGTGNYNTKTARIYEDIGLLSADPELGNDVANLFNFLTGYGREVEYKRLLVAPESLRSQLNELIDNEANSERGRIVIKTNSLVDPSIIERLYEASNRGVQIDLIVRGACCLRPGVAGQSENIRVRSVIGRFLEHSRVYVFGNADGPGEPAYFIGSADLMDRNLDRRVEALVRLTSHHERIREILEILLADQRLAWTLDADGSWTRRRVPGGIDSHLRLQELALERAQRS